MMLDADIVAVSPASVWRVLSRAGLLRRWNGKPSKKGTGFEQPAQPHQHWHIDVSYLNCATFYYLCSILDGYSRFLVHWDLRESMTEADIEIFLERAKERYPGVKPRTISDLAPRRRDAPKPEILRSNSANICIMRSACSRQGVSFQDSENGSERASRKVGSLCGCAFTPATPRREGVQTNEFSQT
jgi:transposase InsO family protein